MRDTGVTHKLFSKVHRLSVSLKHLGLRRDKGVLKRGGKVVGGGVELEMRRD